MKLACLFVLAAAAACGEKTILMNAPPPERPEPRSTDPAQKPIQDYVDALNRADVDAIKHALISPARLRQAVSCKAGAHDMIADLEHELTTLDAQKAQLGGMHVELIKVREVETRSVAVGDPVGNCTANEAFETRTFRWSQRSTSKQGVREGDETNHVLALDGTWYILPL